MKKIIAVLLAGALVAAGTLTQTLAQVRAGRRGAVAKTDNGTAAAGPRGAAVKGEEGYAAAGRRGAVVSGEEGYAAVGRNGNVVTGEEVDVQGAAVGRRGAVVVGEEGAVGVGRYGGVVVGDRMKATMRGRPSPRSGWGSPSARCWRSLPPPPHPSS